MPRMSRRVFLQGASAAAAVAPLVFAGWAPVAWAAEGTRSRKRAKVRAVFLYPPSKTFADDPDGWWSWPGNQYDAEGRQKEYMAAFRDMEKKLGMAIAADDKPVADGSDAQRVATEIKTDKPDGLLIIMFYNQSLRHADLLLKVAEENDIPAVFYIGLGVKHGAVGHYRRPGVYFSFSRWTTSRQ